MAKKKEIVQETQNEQEEQKKVATTKIEEAEIKVGEVIGADDSVQSCDDDKLVVCLNYPQNLQFIVRPGTRDEHTVEFYGNASYLVGKEMGVLPLGAYGLTPNVARSDWEWIAKNHKDSKLIANGLLFAETSKKARDAARERKSLRNGSEPVVKPVNNQPEA